MGDVPPQPTSASDYPTQDAIAGSYPGINPLEGQQAFAQGRGAVDLSSTFPNQFQHPYGPQHAFSSQFDMSQQPQGPGRSGPYNMSAMAGALPQTNFRPGQYPTQQRFNASAPPQNVVGQMPAQYGAQATINPIPGQQYYMPQHAHLGQFYGTPISPSQQQANMSPRGNVGYYPNQLVLNQQQAHPQTAYYYTQAAHYPGQGQALQGQMIPGQYLASNAAQSDPRLGQSAGSDTSSLAFSQAHEQRQPSTDSRSSVVRGPPRKPKQSGHAIWIGNLPPQTDLMSLVHHVCKEAPGLESLFLISKSNCAFANFRDEGSCVGAQQKLHDSKFQSVRLVSRLRKSTVEGAAGVTAPTGPAASTPQQTTAPEPQVNGEGIQSPEESAKVTPVAAPFPVEQRDISPESSTPQKDKFFILKSLTVEDLELSVRTGIWATQAHNEETLNAAFKSVDNVYLVFSANKSGEYFGYARMVSPINEDPAAAIEFAPKAQTASDLDLPKAIPTEATEFAPKGRIIDDSARGTIFWEAEREDQVDGAADSEEVGSTKEGDDSSTAGSGHEGGESKAWGKPFKLEWLSTTRLPFYRTRGLRNPWNSNREVKIARDGTELEPSVGRRLIGLFNRVQSPAPGAMAGMRQGMPPIMVGYPPMAGRPPYQQ